MSHASEPTGSFATRSDGELARLAAAGDRQAAGTLIVRYERLVRSFLRKITGKPDTADDLAQETFVRLLKHADRYDEKYPMRTWLLTIARRLSINHSRRSDQQVVHTEYDGQHANGDGPMAQVEADDMKRVTRRMIDGALAQLSEPQREAVVLFHEQELSIEQVAEVMEMPVGTIKSHLHRARAAMRKILGPQLEVIES
jgi:RNA polymerase sigma-70 factor (ECF subfamily)